MRGQPAYDRDHARGKISSGVPTFLLLPNKSVIFPAKLGLGKSTRFLRSGTLA